MIIRFDELFRESLKPLVLECKGDEARLLTLEESIPDRYNEWLWLDNAELGVAPARYFEEHTALQLCDECREYAAANVDLPDVLIDALIDARDEDACLALLRECADDEGLFRATDAAIEALVRMDSVLAVGEFVGYIVGDSTEELKQRCAEALIAMDGIGCELIAKALHNATPAHATYLADVCAQLGLSEALEPLLELFRRSYEHRALYAACLGRLGDVRALKVLEQALADDDDYLAYTAVLHAYEALGGVVEVRRVFDEDAGALMIDDYIQKAQLLEEQEEDEE